MTEHTRMGIFFQIKNIYLKLKLIIGQDISENLALRQTNQVPCGWQRAFSILFVRHRLISYLPDYFKTVVA